MHRRYLLPAAVAAITLTSIFGCGREAIDTRAADEQAIRTAEIEAVRAFNEGDIDGYMAAYPEDSAWLPPNSPIVNGADAIRALASQLAANPSFAFDVQVTTVEVSRDGGMAYLIGSYQLTLSDPEGNSGTQTTHDFSGCFWPLLQTIYRRLH